MFKIESYITPIIINYIDKYVKDFRPQNAQVSLWGGEVSFQNLDIRLDILQQELNLPLSIVSGHIHELTIRIPWTKIASEPIQINVNTIEFVVKLKSEETTKKEKENEKLVRSPVVQEPPGYMATLINKIANNISIKLNNIIFKYIEEDFVVSMNIQLLSIDSADDDWNPAFIDINPTKVILKKVINISDLTICLDKRNAQGKIDVCQEPILYRCSLQARMIRKYNLSTAHISSTTRIDLFTDYIDFKVSAQQYPMLIRLYLLIQMLKEQRTSVYINQKKGSEGYGGVDSIITDADASYMYWMWNMLPEFFPKDEEVDSAEPHGHIYHTGFYAKKINITLKSQEIVSNSIIQSTTTLKYHPFLKISLYGLYFDAVSVGRMWYNLKGGISYIGLFPVGNCTCGKKHNFPTIFLSGKKVKDDKNLYLSDSLKDSKACENQDQLRMYETDFERYLASNSQEELLKKTPALAIDIVSHREFLDESKTYSAHSMSNADTTAMSEEYYLRVIFGDFNFKLDSTLLHLTQTLNEHYEQYVYTAPYVRQRAEETLAHLTPPSTEDYDSLLECVPLRKYNFYFNRPQIELYYTDSEHIPSLSSNDFHRLPYLLINLHRVEVNMISPLYADKLVHTTCQLPNPPEVLKTHCFNKTKVTVKNTSVNVMLRESNSFLAITIKDLKFNNDVLLKPDFWKLIQLPSTVYDLNVTEMTVCVNKPQLMLLLLLYETYTTRNYSSLVKTITNANFVDIVDWNLPVLDVHLNQLQLLTMIIDKTVGIDAYLRSVCGYAFIPNHLKATSKENFYKFKTIFLSNEHLHADILKCTVQFPLDMKTVKYPPILTIVLGKAILNADLLFQEFLNYNVLWDKKQIDSAQSFNVEEKSFPRKQMVRKTSRVRSFHRTESVHSNSMMTLSAVNSSVKAREKDRLHYIKWYDIIKCLIIHVDLKVFTIVCPSKSLYMHQETANINNILIDSRHLLLTRFRLPSLAIESSKFKHFCTVTNNTFPIAANETVWSANQSGFPWTFAMNDCSCDVVENNVETIFLAPVHTKVTLDLIDKSKSIEFSGEEMSFVIHMDTTPIELNLWPKPMQHVYNSIQLLSSCMLLSSQSSAENPVYTLEHPPQIYDFQINDFICETTNSEISSEDIVPAGEVSSNRFTFLIQWTITKFGIILFGSNQQSDVRIIFELEDIITSIDKQKTYLKAKTKVGSLNGLREKGVSSNIDKLSIISRSDTLADNSQETFFELVATKAITNNVHNKWGAKKTMFAGRNENDTITELMVTMQSVDLKLELDVLYVISSILEAINQNKQINPNESKKVVNTSTTLSVKALPLIFFNCKGLQLWIPALTSSSSSDVFIFKVNAITIAPTVQNPINRKPVREDIYSKAEQLRVINTPGSEVEDRQYELLVKDLSIGTGNWKEILNFTQSTNVKSELLIENPAFEWNNQTQKPSLNVNTIFKDVVISVVYAPTILFHNILVCGQAVEINCVNDLFLKISLDDLTLLNNLYLDLIDTFIVNNDSACQNHDKIDSPLLNEKQFTKNKLKRSSYMRNSSFDTESSDNQWSDSGFRSDSKKNDMKAITTRNVPEIVVPFVFTFIGGLIGIKLYRRSVSTGDDLGNEPLISVKIMQPNLHISKEPLKIMQRMSIYNVIVSLYDAAMFKETSEEFCDTIFDTSLGDLDSLGVPPPLLKLQKKLDIATNELTLKCDILKPMKIRVTSDNIEKILNLKKLLDDTLTPNRGLVRQEHKPSRIVRYKNIKVIKQMFSDAKHIDFSMTKTVINCITSKNCSLNLSFLNAKCKLGFHQHPERLVFDSLLNSLVINTEHSIILHPLTVDFNCTLTQEKWNPNLLTTVNFKSNIINFQICPNDVQTIAKVKVDFLNCINEFSKSTDAQSNVNATNEDQLDSVNIKFDRKNLIPLYASHNENVQKSSTVEHFQDDLRLGAFQYVTTSSTETLPLPYQIYLETEGENSEICWRYPHPRVINKLQIYPLAKQSNVDITCYLEYYQESHTIFFPFCSFKLDNRELREIALPKRKVSASMWRIKIVRPIAFLDHLENEEERDFYDVIGPRDILGCIRIDSLFSVKNIPIIQANINITDLSVTILNNFHVPNLKMPDMLKQYTLQIGDHLNNTQEFCRLCSPKINASFSLFSEMDMTMYNEFQFGIDIFDYSYLTMQPLLENVTIKSYVEVAMNSSDERDNVCYLIVDKLNFKYGPTAGHAITTAKQIWQNILKADESEYNLPIVTRYIVCNSTSVPFKFGQDATDEQIWLRPNYCFYYAFRNQNHKQGLKFMLDTEETCATCHFDDSEELSYLPINQEKLLLITTKKISTTQRQIIVKGQIEILNMTKETFQIHYKSNLPSDDDSKLSNQSAILLPAESVGSFFAKCDESSNHVIRLHLDGANGSGWSGEIPLHTYLTHVPWLVKVPTKAPQKYTSYSVRIHRENIENLKEINGQPLRVLIVIWPLFVARSMLPMDLIATDIEFEKNYVLSGKGECEDLQVAGTYDTEHEFLFDLGSNPNSGNDKWKTVLSFKGIDKKSFFTIPDRYKSINDILKELEKPVEIKWPCSKEGELTMARHTTKGFKSAMPLYKFAASRELSCSLSLDVLPWCLFINAIGVDIKITNSAENISCLIESNHIAVPVMITTAFNIEMKFGNEWCSSCLIYINECKPVHKSKSYVKLPEEGHVLLEVWSTNGFSKFILTSSVANSTRIISLIPLAVLCNFSKNPLKYFAFCVAKNEKQSYDTIAKSVKENLCLAEMPSNKMEETCLFKGQGITRFVDLTEKSNATNNLKNMNYYLMVGTDDDRLSTPILLNRPMTRYAFGISSANGEISIALSVMEYNGQFFISICNDHYPFIEIDNQTNVSMIVSEAEYADYSKTSKPRRSRHFDNFQWFCNVDPHRQINYTPPSINENFPDKPVANNNLIFACTSKLTTGVSIQWSVPIDISKVSQKFMALPLHGDVKLTIGRTNKTTKIVVENIDIKTEFNVKNVRTKLSSPHKEITQHQQINYDDEAYIDVNTKHDKSTETKSVSLPLFLLNASIYIKDITISLYNEDKQALHKKNDIVSLYLDDVFIDYLAEKRSIEFACGNVQIDNKLYSSGKYDFPVIFCGQENSETNTHSYEKNNSEEHSSDKSIENGARGTVRDSSHSNRSNFNDLLPFLLQEIKSKHMQTPLVSIQIILENSIFSPDEIHCNFKPFRIYVEDKFIAVLIDFMIENLPSNIIYATNAPRERVVCESGQIILPRVITEQILTLVSEPLKFRWITIKPLSVLLSVHTCMRMYIALDHSPLHFAQFEIKNVYTTTMRMGYNIGMHYVSGAIFGAGWVVGSLEILGSPSGLARSVTTGLWDFVSMPVQGLFRGPWGFLLGLTHGSASLLKNVTAGTVNSVTKLAASVARNLDRLTLDDEHLERTEAIRRSRPQGITHGFTQGLTGFGISLLGAVGGIARHALEAKSSVQVFTGLGKGLVGVVTKPISGFSELLALTGQGVLQTVGFNTLPTSRSASTQRRNICQLSATKIIWKILPKISYPDQVLFVSLGKLLKDSKYEEVTTAITTKLILIISNETIEPIEVLSLSNIVAAEDEENPCMVHLYQSEDVEAYRESQFHHNRILQYVSSSHQQMSMKKTENGNEPPKTGNQNANQKVILYTESNLAKYFVNYVQLIKHSLNK